MPKMPKNEMVFARVPPDIKAHVWDEAQELAALLGKEQPHGFQSAVVIRALKRDRLIESKPKGNEIFDALFGVEVA